MGQGLASNLPYEVGEKFDCLEGKTVWSVHKGKKKADADPVTVFVYEVKSGTEEQLKVAKEAYQKLKTFRHPSVVTFVDGIQNDTTVTMVTEPVVPLEEYLKQECGQNVYSISWGIHQIAKCQYFLNKDCNLVHGNVCAASVFVDEAGEWKLAGFEYTRLCTDSPSPKLWDSLKKYDPPEGSKPSISRKLEKWSWDTWGLGCLIWEVFNGLLTEPASLKVVDKLPKSLVPHYCELVSANPRSRPDPLRFLENCKVNGHFMDNQFVSINLQLEELQFMDESKRTLLFNALNKELDNFPQKFSQYRILPLLINAFEFGGAGSSVLPPLFQIGKMLDETNYQAKIVPCVIKLFSSTDRATRINLLQQLTEFVQHLKPATVEKEIYPNVSTGFLDTIPAMREATVKSMVLLAPKLSEKTINNQLLKQFARLQMDEQPGIRTNTTLCLGKIAPCFSESTRQKVLIPAFTRALRDSFGPARLAGISAIMNTKNFYKPNDVANRLLPPLCSLTLDPNKDIRNKTFQAIEMFLTMLKELSESPQASADQVGLQSNVVGTASSWAGWAYSSLASKLSKAPETCSVYPAAQASNINIKPAKSDEVSDTGEDQRLVFAKDDDDRQSQSLDGGSFENQSDAPAHDSDLGDWEDDGWSVSPAKEESQLIRTDHPASSFFDDAGEWGSSQDDWASDWSYSSSKKALAKGKGQTLFVKNAGFIKDGSLPSASALFSNPQTLEVTSEVSQPVSSKSAEMHSKQAVSDDWDDGDWESPVTPINETASGSSTVDLKAESTEWTDDKWETLDGTGWEPIHEVKSTRQAQAEQRGERQLKQQAARQKRSAELKTSKAMRLGGVKKSA